jgi:glycerophosphoryl diester phosphodiesterase
MSPTSAGAPLRIAHGYGNSRELVQIALEDRVDVIEADVRLRGGRLRLGHERRLPLLPLLFGRRPRGQSPRSRLAFALGPWQVRLDSGPFPLDEMLAMVTGKCGLLLDLKSPLMAGNRRRFVEALLAILRQFNQTGVRLCGDWPLLDEVRGALPESKVYYSVAGRHRWQAFVRRVEGGDPVRGISLRASLLDASTAQFLQERGIEVYCWPMDSSAEAARVTALGAAGIISYDLAVLAATGGAAGDERR